MSQSAAKAVKDQEKQNAENVERHLAYNAVQTHAQVDTSDGGQIELHAVAGEVFLNTHGERVLSRDDLVTLQQKLAAAFQTVA